MHKTKGFRTAAPGRTFQRLQAVAGTSAVQLVDEVQRPRRRAHAFIDVTAAEVARRKLRQIEGTGQRVVITSMHRHRPGSSAKVIGWTD
ncbi:hypothetical protein SK803_43565 [Lentzea sp. BCCO 10_0856]|uniref:Uncharacterized protein n=1 Tax=Lentzea miocenica TaxID=3095431 RepID=A0ABU4TFY4_9PSEU|nr:hypothetical protein [Lentzea sp. BCCO 10_0856]MDX8037113.1 hypothetical protein [Lentzea sp. BCCO 10_0856]